MTARSASLCVVVCACDKEDSQSCQKSAITSDDLSDNATLSLTHLDVYLVQLDVCWFVRYDVLIHGVRFLNLSYCKVT